MEITLEKEMKNSLSNEWDFLANPVLTMKVHCYHLSNQALFEMADPSEGGLSYQPHPPGFDS